MESNPCLLYAVYAAKEDVTTLQIQPAQGEPMEDRYEQVQILDGDNVDIYLFISPLEANSEDTEWA